MKTIYMHLSIGYPTASKSEELEVEDDATEEEIDQQVKEWTDNYIEWGWSTEKPKRLF
jgi:hypothetical protein